MTKIEKKSSAKEFIGGLLTTFSDDEADKTITRPDVREKSGAEQRVVSPSISQKQKSRPERVDILSISPDRIRIWEKHDRDYSMLNEDNCKDLIEGFKANGQKFATIVREIDDPDDKEHAYEIVVGARRHWTAYYLGMPLKVEIRNVSDKEAFELQEEENRKRKDISDYERAIRYKAALAEYYEGNQKKMAHEAAISAGFLSKHLAIMELPEEIMLAFRSPYEVTARHAGDIRPLLKEKAKRNAVIEEAKRITGKEYTGAEIVALLKKAAEFKKEKRGGYILNKTINGKDGKPIFTAQRGRTGGLKLVFRKEITASKEEIKESVFKMIEQQL